jgi:hypothetical protein
MRQMTKDEKLAAVEEAYFDASMWAHKKGLAYDEFTSWFFDIVKHSHDFAIGFAEGLIEELADEPVQSLIELARKDAEAYVLENIKNNKREYDYGVRTILIDPSMPRKLAPQIKDSVTSYYPPGLKSLLKYLLPTEATP